MPEHDSAYIAWVSARIVRMFERYAGSIDPEDEGFKTFISKYVGDKAAKDPKTLPYSQLYKVIRDGIREYLKQQEPEPKK